MEKIESYKRFAVFASGDGSNFESLVQKVHKGHYPLQICCVVSDKPEARVLERAKNHKIPGICIPKVKGTTRADHEQAILEKLDSYSPEFIVLAGYMRILGEVLLSRFENRMINIHPSLLPAFKGVNGAEQAWEYGVRYAGCTVHIVTQGMDEGPILGQRTVKVKPNWSKDDLKLAILKEEHVLLPACTVAFSKRNWRIEGRRIVWN